MNHSLPAFLLCCGILFEYWSRGEIVSGSSDAWPFAGLLLCGGLAIRVFYFRNTTNQCCLNSKNLGKRPDQFRATNHALSQSPHSPRPIDSEAQWGAWLLAWGVILYLDGIELAAQSVETGWSAWPIIRGMIRGYNLVGIGFASWFLLAFALWSWRLMAGHDEASGGRLSPGKIFKSFRFQVIEPLVAFWHPTNTIILVLAIAQEIQDRWRESPTVATLLIAASSAALIARGARRWLNTWIPSEPLTADELRILRDSDPEIAAALDAGWEIRNWSSVGNVANACLMPTPKTVWRWRIAGPQRVLVSPGLRRLLEPQELAAIIRHEIAHGVLQHGRCRMWGLLVPTIVGVAGVSQTWTAAASSGVGTIPGPGMWANLIASILLACVVGSLISHWCEFAADRWACGVPLPFTSQGTAEVRRRFFDRNRIRHLESALEKLKLRQARRQARGTWFHPRIETRIKHLRHLAGATSAQ